MSAALVSDPTAPQTFVDDLESAFYVILWLVLMYTDSSMTARERTTVMQHVMDPQPVEGMGGHGKADFLQGQGVLRKLTLENPDQSRFKTLLVDLATLFSVRYEAEPPQMIGIYLMGLTTQNGKECQLGNTRSV